MAQAFDEHVQQKRIVNKRLLLRHAVNGRIEIEWLSSRHRKGLRRRLVVPTAEVLDLSMGGMLVEAPAEPRFDVDETVELASEGHTASARVTHKHEAIDPDKQLLGIEFVAMSEPFEASLHEAVRALRG
jgi:hypothetical protein